MSSRQSVPVTKVTTRTHRPSVLAAGNVVRSTAAGSFNLASEVEPTSRSHLKNITGRDRERDRIQNTQVGMSPGFRNATSYPHDLNLIGTPDQRSSTPKGLNMDMSVPSKHRLNSTKHTSDNVRGSSTRQSVAATSTSTTSGHHHETNFAFRKSATMGSISKAQDNIVGITSDHQADSANVVNNNYSRISMGGNNNNFSGLEQLNDTKNCSVTSSLAGFALGGYKTPMNVSKVSTSRLNPSPGGSDQSGGLMSRYLAGLYKNVNGHDMGERNLDEAMQFLRTQAESSTMSNETRCVEKLKIHLIHQTRHNEAKRFTELHQKLKGMQMLKNREAIVTLFYELFDKEQTRAALVAKRSERDLNPSSNGNTMSFSGATFGALSPKRNQNATESVNVRSPSCLTDDRMSSGQETGYFSTIKSPRNIDGLGRNQSKVSTFDSEFDPTAMPNLHYTSDAIKKNEIHSSQSRMPNLQYSRNGQGSLAEKRNVDNYLNNTNNLRGKNSDEGGKVISFPKDYGRNLLSEEIEKQSGTSSSLFNRPSKGTSGHQIPFSYGQGTRPGSRTFTGSKSIERELIKDLVFVFQGIDGNLVKSNSKGMFEIITRQHVHPSLRLQTLRLCELGHFYKKMRNYCDKPTIGLMAQGLKHALEKELQEFYRLLAIVQSQTQQNMVDTPMSEDMPRSGEEMTILKLTVWMLDSRPRLEILAGMIDACQDKRGGEMCSVLYRYSLHGDPMVCNVTNSLLSTVAKPLFLMLCQWILYGELEDPYNEFFIAADSSCKKEQLWHSKYHIRRNMLPSFITMKQAERVLATGKNINFLKEICHNAKGYDGRNQIKSLLERSPVECMFMEEDKLLNATIEKAYKTTSEMVLIVLIQESKLIDHLQAIKNYLLLGQGDFIQHLLELIQDELSKPASKLFTHNTSAILESAIRATNAQFEKEDILCRLDTRILPSSDKDLGWDVFCLDYKVHGPIGTVLAEDVMIRYNQLFNALWRTKRIEMILSTLWKSQTTLFKYQRTIPELGPVLHRSQLLISEMIHFVHQTQYYIMFEATECAWDRLMEEVSKASDLDEVIKAHDKFLQSITSRSLLDPESRELLNQLRGIFDSVHELKSFLMEFDSRVTVELQCRKGLKPNSEEQQEAQRHFFANYIIQAKGKIETLYTTTQDLVRSFLLVLNRQPDLTLQCLSFRLDFNEYYHFKDSRLSQPLTFQHRRMSSNTFDPLNTSLSGTGVNHSLYTSMSIPENVAED